MSPHVRFAYARLRPSHFCSTAVLAVIAATIFGCTEPRTAPPSELSPIGGTTRAVGEPTPESELTLEAKLAALAAMGDNTGALVAAPFTRASIVADAATYTVTSIPFGLDPTPTGTHPNLGGDDVVTGPLPIGFNFEYFGVTYSMIDISTNGFVGFTSPMSQGCCEGRTIPQNEVFGGGALNNLIAAIWTDLYPPNGGQITFGVSGTAPNRRFIVHWRDLSYFFSTPNRVNVQLKLFEGSNNIEIHSRAVTPDVHARTQGIENATGTVAYFVPGRVASFYTLSNDAVRFSSGDNTPPEIAVVVTGTLGDNDWYTSDVSIDWTVTDNESAVTSTTGCDDLTITTDQASVTYTCTATSAGGTSSESVSVQRDATDPLIAYSGNAGTYTVDQTVNITCAASDAMSGLASNTCADITGAAYTFGLGSHTFSASATDNAGNSASASTTFTVVVTTPSLCALIELWVEQQGIANSLCQKLDAASSREGKARENILDAFRHEVEAQSGKHIPADIAAILLTLVGGL